MIYYCDNCINRHDCPENQEQYKKACLLMAATLYEIEHNPETHCFYSATMRCDYFYPDQEVSERYAQAANNYKRFMKR